MLFNIFDYLTSLELLAIIICLVSGFILLCMFLYVLSLQRKKIKQGLKKVNCSVVYVIDFKTELVTHFKVFSPSNKDEISYKEFCEMVEKEEKDNFKCWIKDVANEVPFRRDYFICNDFKQKETLLFKFLKTNTENNVLYLEVEFFNNLSKSIISRNKSNTFLDENDIVEYYKTLRKNRRKNIAIYFVNMFDDLEINDGNFSLRYLSLLKLLNEIAPNLGKSVLFYFINNYKLCIVDFKARGPKQVIKSANRINELMTKIISFESSNKAIDYRICVLTKFNAKTFNINARIHDAEDFSEYAKNSNIDDKLVYYNKNINLNASYHSVVVDELNRIINFNAFKVLYKPFIDIKMGKNKGYIAEIQIMSNIINKYESFEIEAYNQGKEKECLELIINNSVKAFKDASTKYKNKSLFIPIFFPFLASLNASMINDIDTQMVFILEGKTINLWSNSDFNSKEILDNAKKLGLQLALYIENKKSFISKDFLQYFTYVIFSDSMINEISPESLTRILLYEYIKENKDQEYIALGISSWIKTELYIMVGINYLAGPIIGEAKEILEDSNKKPS